jgi:hypothetical protein
VANYYRTSKLTALPAYTFCPATGTCKTIMLAGEGCAGGPGGACAAALENAPFVASPSAAPVEATTLTFPSLNPESCKLLLALPNGCPTKFGITNA